MKKEVILIAIVFCLLFSPVFVIGSNADVTVWVEAALGVDISGDTNIQCYRGEECGTWLTIKSNANVRDMIKLEAYQNPEEPHLLYDFECAETIGICGNRTVNEMILTPQQNKTRVYLDIMPLSTSLDNDNIEIRGWSQTNKTYSPSMIEIKVNVDTRNSTWDPLEAPGLGITSILILFVISPVIFTLTKRN
ncbi:MAG: hypothetical protein ABEK17_04935 [Candidatus Aenigmatarchaeota archaeon]